jgi:molybdopterin converting factor small subunit
MKILAFAAARERTGFSELEIPAEPSETPRALLARVAPSLTLDSLRAAIDYEYWDWDTPIGLATELAIIPAVSGG